MLLVGSMSVTTVRLIARRLTAENHAELLAAAAGKSRSDVQDARAPLPQSDVPASVRKLPVRAAETKKTVRRRLSRRLRRRLRGSGSDEMEARLPRPDVFEAPARPAVVRPLGPARYEIRFTASEETRDRLRHRAGPPQPRDPERRYRADRRPRADPADQGPGAAEVRRHRSRPRDGRVASEDSNHIPAAVKREVMARDGGGCRFVAADGHRCGATRLLQFHHVIPRAAGGPTTAANIELRCRAHNGYEVDFATSGRGCGGEGWRPSR